MTKNYGLIAVALIVSSAFLACSRNSLRADPKAQDALLALKKLEAKTEYGMPYRDYSVALGDANFTVKLFLESANAASAPEFTKSLRNAMKWNGAAAELWHRHMEADFHTGYCSGSLQSLEDASPLCNAYPELITSTKDYRVTPSHLPEVPVIIYELAMQEAWKRAAFELKNADHYMNGEQPEQQNDKLFKVEKNEQERYLTQEALKRFGVR